MPKSGVHRILTELTALGYARKTDADEYVLTLRILSLAQWHSGRATLRELLNPALEELAEAAGDLVRLSVEQDGRLNWIARAQGATSGLIYDDINMPTASPLLYTTSGIAWLSTWAEHDLKQIISDHDWSKGRNYGPNAPKSLKEFQNLISRTQEQGFAYEDGLFEDRLATIAIPIRTDGTHNVIGILSISGPNHRLTRRRAIEILPHMEATVNEVAPVVYDLRMNPLTSSPLTP